MAIQDEKEDSSVDVSNLPILTSMPKVYSGCCLALSSRLLCYLRTTLLSNPGPVLSVGSGYGLLEAIMLAPPYDMPITGVEVHPSSNRYLPPTHHRVVPGSRFMDSLAEQASVWMFVYPKRVGLITDYISRHGAGNLKAIIWMGPRADWEDYRVCFATRTQALSWSVDAKSADQAGGAAWEMVAVATKLT
ncbi:hypothetical protein M011DRAFT_403987 [Sporormia fimetaria CBS 119925]|uniref:Uncharacterized protein n=1 Tax=Sporormia fimetaria CBS 119925 TaxID=1340428 RepID=A0A6A6VBX5_9PLEO|nr:hypothetical protein M011DRAFT_403987 [Sporormia fimetaria CBS 119925]